MINFNFQATTGIYVGAKDVYIAQVKGIAQLKGTPLGPRLVKFGRAEIQAQKAQSDKEHRQAIVQAVKRVVQENNITTKKVITALPGKNVLIRYFQMPKIPKPEWETAIKFESKKYIPFKIEELMWSYQVASAKGKDTKMDITFVAVKKEIAQSHVSLLKEADLEPLILEPAPFSLLRLFVLGNQLVKGKPVAIVDVDYGMADINIVKDKICYLTRDVSLPLEGEEAVFDSLLNEISMSLDYYEKLFPAETIAKILLCGEVELRDWDRKLAEELKISVEKADIARVIKIQKVLPPLSMALAIGLALRGTALPVIEVNLYRVHEVKPMPMVTKEGLKFTPEIRQAVFRAGMISCIGLLILHLIMFWFIVEEKKKLEAVASLRPKINLALSNLSYTRLEKEKEEIEKKASFLNLFMDERLFWTTKFNELPKIVPPGVWLTNFSFIERLPKDNRINRSLTIKGEAYHEDTVQEIEAISKFVSNMHENEGFSGGFEEIKLDSMTSRKMKGMPVKNFTISCIKE